MQVRTTILRLIFILISIASLAYVANLKAEPSLIVQAIYHFLPNAPRADLRFNFVGNY